ncbi:MAG: peptidyl-prolyl cis-trans isomerase SurA [Holosporales bacterium]|jgi:peptidyl-prolyl cis-trans isomerase SurA|nr:peptidyl-prolyl cis-trans isomerase SurA [Holosporales bacterium]
MNFLYILIFFILLCLDKTYSKTNDIDISALGTPVTESELYKFDRDDEENNKKTSQALSALKIISQAKQTFLADKNKNLCPVEKVYISPERRFFIVAKVNSEVITNIDVINAIKFVFFSSGKKYDKVIAKLMIKSIVYLMMDSRLHQQYARSYKLKIKKEDVDERINKIAENNKMTVDDLAQKFEKLGINMEIFRKNIESRMLLSFIVEIIGEDIGVSKQEILEERAKIATDIKHPRYHLYEIFFRVDNPKTKKLVRENAEATLKLLKDGFSFQVLSENMSQGHYTGTVGDLGWVRDESLEAPVKNAVRSLKIGEFSDIIETRTGYKIIYVYDKAEPNKAGHSLAKYHILKSTMQYKSGLFTQKDAKEVDEKIDSILKVDSAEKYKFVCKKYNIDVEELKIEQPDAYIRELIERSKTNKVPAILQSMEDEDKINLLFLVKEEFPDAGVPSEEETSELISARKIEKEFSRNLKRLKNTAHMEIYNDQLEKIIQ